MLKKIFRIALIVLVLAFVIAQFVRPNFTNPPVVQGEDLPASTQVPADVEAVLTRSCSDCHSNETRYPWYSKVTPFNWFLADHIEDGRKEMNFSVWNTYAAKKKVRKLEELCEQVEHGEMPLPSYLWIHSEAKMRDGDAALLCNWARAEGDRIKAANGPIE
jgi:hypothetical protein